MLFRQGRADEALALLDRAVTDNPADIGAMSLKAEMLHARGRPTAEALACFDSLLKNRPELAETWKRRAVRSLPQAT